VRKRGTCYEQKNFTGSKELVRNTGTSNEQMNFQGTQELLKCHSKAKRRALAYSQALVQIREVV